jgi:TPR repeat protein/AcrR family transcriptional regulator
VGIGVAGIENNAGIRGALIVAARGQLGRDDLAELDIGELCTAVGIPRTEFSRFFADRDELIAAVLEEDVAQLKGFADAAAVEQVPRAVANGPAIIAPAPQGDAWLERRLRVFERALSALESRQEKTEQLLNRSVALVEERLASVAEKPVAAPEPTPALKRSLDAEIPPRPVKAKPLPLPDLDPPPAMSPEEMDGLLENARRAAREASVSEEPAVEPRRFPRWMTWAGLGAILVVAAVALFLAHMMGVKAGSVQHRETLLPPQARIAALADSGDPRAQTKLALTYLHGQDAKADLPAALRWGLAAAKQGDPMAQYLIATFYAEGNGVATDLHQAFRWFEAAALRGNLKAMHDLAIAYDEGRGTERDPGRAAAWFNRAATQGYVDSQFDLAVLYERGDGVMQNPVLALKWYLVAAKSGDAQARDRADQLSREMPEEESARAHALADSFRASGRDPVANAL